MAFYDNEKAVQKTDKPAKYQVARKPGEKPSSPGIYKCQSCGYEDVINRECDTLPPCANCDRKPHSWKLLVTATDK